VMIGQLRYRAVTRSGFSISLTFPRLKLQLSLTFYNL